MTWKPVTEREYRPEPPKPDDMAFARPAWTHAEQSKLALARAQVERHKRNRNEPKARRA